MKIYGVHKSSLLATRAPKARARNIWLVWGIFTRMLIGSTPRPDGRAKDPLPSTRPQDDRSSLSQRWGRKVTESPGEVIPSLILCSLSLTPFRLVADASTDLNHSLYMKRQSLIY